MLLLPPAGLCLSTSCLLALSFPLLQKLPKGRDWVSSPALSPGPGPQNTSLRPGSHVQCYCRKTFWCCLSLSQSQADLGHLHNFPRSPPLWGLGNSRIPGDPFSPGLVAPGAGVSPLGEGTSGIRQESASPGPAEGVPTTRPLMIPGKPLHQGTRGGWNEGWGSEGVGSTRLHCSPAK